MKVLLTGAFGRLGSQVAAEALARGHELRCHDLDGPANRAAAAALDARAEVVLGDLTTADLPALLDGIDGVVHTAALLPPQTELQADLAERVNVDTCLRLIDAIAAAERPPVLVYPSTFSVFARTDDRPRPRTVADPVAATDNYTRHKLTIEAALAERDLPWTVLRVGVSVDARTLSTDRATFAALLAAQADSPVHWVHPRDVALAMVRALEVDAARGRTLLIGGPDDCRVTQERFVGTAFRALGLRYPAGVHGDAYYYMHWLDTSESQALLGFQRHGFDAYEAEMAQRLRWVRRGLAPLRWLVNPTLGPALRRI